MLNYSAIMRLTFQHVCTILVSWTIFSMTSACSNYYTVQSGDTLMLIQSSLNLDLQKLKVLNPDLDLEWIHPGDKICIQRSVAEGITHTQPTSSLSSNSIPTPPKPCKNYPLPFAIINGNESKANKWPWQVLIRLASFDDSFPEQNICGGVLIDDRTILTAAHCIINNRKISGYRIGLGVHNRSEFKFNDYVNISKIILHKGYLRDRKEHDLGALILQNPVGPGPTVQPILLPEEDLRTCPRTEAFATGWGDTLVQQAIGPSPSLQSDVLLEAKVKIFDHKRCKRIYGNSFTENMVCAGGKSRADSCQGDSGGPLVIHDPARGSFVLLGVVSWGEGCGLADKPGVYTKVSSYLPWIRQILLRR